MDVGECKRCPNVANACVTSVKVGSVVVVPFCIRISPGVRFLVALESPFLADAPAPVFRPPMPKSETFSVPPAALLVDVDVVVDDGAVLLPPAVSVAADAAAASSAAFFSASLFFFKANIVPASVCTNKETAQWHNENVRCAIGPWD
jgi:hypothetical protein